MAHDEKVPLIDGKGNVVGDALRSDVHGNPGVEAVRRTIDMKASRYEWRAAKLLRGDERPARRYLFQSPEGLRWVLLEPFSWLPRTSHLSHLVGISRGPVPGPP